MTSPYSFTSRSNGQTILATHINELQDAIVEIGSPIDPFRTGFYYDTRHGYSGFADTVALDATDRLYFCPFYIGPSGVSVDRIGITVTSGAAGNCRLGIYSDHATTGAPDALIDDSGEVDVSTGGLKEITISETLVPASDRCRVWLAIVGAVSPTLLTLQSNTGRFGGDSVASGGNSRNGWFKAHTYGALPASISSPGLGTNVPIIYLRAA